MSHTVTITRTTTTSSGTALLLNTGFLKSGPGLLKLAQLLLGAACVGLVSYVVDHGYKTANGYFSINVAPLFYLIAATACLVGTFCLFLSCLSSLSSAAFISKTNYEVIFHSLAFVLYLIASILLIVEIEEAKSSRYKHRYYNEFLAAAIMGFVMSVLYFVSTYFAYRTHKAL